MTWPFGALRRHHYGAIYADPPWQFLVRSDKGQGRSPERHYKTMDLAWIMALPVWELAARDCVLFLWISSPNLKAGLQVMHAWGFEYKTVAFTWHKTKPSGREHLGQGYWTRSNPEQCWLGVRGAPARKAADVREFCSDHVREHSRKPAEIARRIERLVDGPYCELFQRTARPGWDAWGNQLGKFGVET